MNNGPRFTAARWLRQTEAASLSRDKAVEAEAALRWHSLGSPSFRMALVREIVATRAAELTLAYRNVVAVVAGYRTRCSADGTEQIHPDPCVIFMVRRKWSPSDPEDSSQRLPRSLLTFGPDVTQPAGGTTRCSYSVPTDVQLATRHAGARTQASASVNVADKMPKFVLPGSLTCAVRLRGTDGSESRFALSAMHVLSPVPRQTGAIGVAAFKEIGS